MERTHLAFIRASLVFLVLGALSGLALAGSRFWPGLYAVKPAHTHLMLFGFVMMLIFGIAYHVLPKFVGRSLFSPPLAEIQFWVALAGGILLPLGLAWENLHVASRLSRAVAIAGGIAVALSLLLFALNMALTLPPRRS